jgi:uncharacterized protein involved in exopolysaccharide biosynthesis
MRTVASDDNPELVSAQRELEIIRQQLAKLEDPGPGKNPAAVAAGGQHTDNFRLLRDVKYHEILHDLLAKQYEMARIDEARDASLIQVLDKAIEPEQKSKPKRTVMVVLAGCFALFASVIIAFVLEWLRNAASRPGQAERLDLLKRFLALR